MSSSSSSNSAATIDRATFWSQIQNEAKKQLTSTRDGFALCANLSSLIYHRLQSVYGPSAVNWVGFYFLRQVSLSQPETPTQEDEATKQKREQTEKERGPKVNQVLVLGPFHGQPAVCEIPLSRGVCGKCARSQETQLVEDVHACEYHIACDPKSQSEICIPIFKSSTFIGMLDIDCPVVRGLTRVDVDGLIPLLTALTQHANFEPLNAKVDCDIREFDEASCSLSH